ncbi:MAG: hypothetical protein NTW25_03730 [Candidatus Kapabacteria bacterium]|nr:hypothetical protein [Candidatus Kapabacteria bacterium]
MYQFYSILSLLFGLIIGFLVSNFRISQTQQEIRKLYQKYYNQFDKDFVSFKANSILEFQEQIKQMEGEQVENFYLINKLDELTKNLSELKNKVDILNDNYYNFRKNLGRKPIEELAYTIKNYLSSMKCISNNIDN